MFWGSSSPELPPNPPPAAAETCPLGAEESAQAAAFVHTTAICGGPGRDHVLIMSTLWSL